MSSLGLTCFFQVHINALTGYLIVSSTLFFLCVGNWLSFPLTYATLKILFMTKLPTSKLLVGKKHIDLEFEAAEGLCGEKKTCLYTISL